MAKTLFFDHNVLSDTGLVSGVYAPKTDAEFNRLEPYSVKAPEADKAGGDDETQRVAKATEIWNGNTSDKFRGKFPTVESFIESYKG